MAFESERAAILQIVDRHSSVPVRPEFSTPAARLIVRRCETLKRKPPLVIERFLDRADGPKGQDGYRAKLARDLFHAGLLPKQDYEDLPEEKKQQVIDVERELFNPAGQPPYFKAGLTFAEGHSLLMETIRERDKQNLPQEIQTALADFEVALSKDVDEAAKHAGFYKSYSDANQALRIATAGPHRINQSIPIVTTASRR